MTWGPDRRARRTVATGVHRRCVGVVAVVVAVGGVVVAPAAAADGVVRVAGADRAATAAAVADRWDAADVVVVASGRDFPDALAGAALADAVDGPLLLVEPRALPAATAAEIERLGATEVIVLGGAAVVADEVLAQLRAMDGVEQVRRVAGADRAATAAAVAREVARLGGATAVVAVAAGGSFPDALAAANTSGPVLLAQAEGLPRATAEALGDLGAHRAAVLGGTAVLAASVEDALRAHGVTPERLAGQDRFATALAAADRVLAASSTSVPLVVASGEGFPDALAGGALARHVGGALVLVGAEGVPEAVDRWLRSHRDRFSEVIVVGGEAAVSVFALSQVEAAVGGPAALAFSGAATSLPPSVRAAMTGVSWREGCPVGLQDLALLEIDHVGFDGERHRGRLVVAASVAEGALGAFRSLYEARFPIERMVLIDVYGGDDDRSMAANNTSGFNCRVVAGTTRWSEHAYGTAIDVNPVQNPYVRGSVVEPAAGAAYLDRSDVRPGMVVRPGPVLDAFGALGWGWGGDWSESLDYQHLSQSGR